MRLIIDIAEETYINAKSLGLYLCPRDEKELEKAIKNAIPYNPTDDCISREALRKAIHNSNLSGNREWLLMELDNIIDNAPTVEPFTQLEKEEIADAITYLLDAELLEENGYTEEVINALKSALKKVGGAE